MGHRLQLQVLQQVDAHAELNADMKARFIRDPVLWRRLPISEGLLRYAVDDVSQLPALASKLTAEIDRAQMQLLQRLSTAHSQQFWLPADQDVSRTSSETEHSIGCISTSRVMAPSIVCGGQKESLAGCT